MEKRPLSLSLAMIVKDEQSFLAQCLDSVKMLVDEMVIVDTGSSDATVDIAESYGARIYHHPWQDSFSEARNYGLQYVTGDWVLQLDADEVLHSDDISLVRQLISKETCDAFSVIFLNDGPDNTVFRHRNVRLFRRGKVHYEGIVHNLPMVNGTAEVSPIRILHHGYNLSPDTLTKKFKRSEILLRRQVHEEPLNTYARANWVRNLRLQSRFEQVILEGEEALQLSCIRLFDRQMILNDMMYASLTLHQIERAEQLGREGLTENSMHLDLLFMMGGVRVQQERFQDAIAYFQSFLRIRESGSETSGLEGLLMDTYGHAGRAWNNIARCEAALGHSDHAVSAYQEAIAHEPRNVIYHRDLAATWLKQERTDEAESVLQSAVDAGIGDDVVERILDRIRVLNLSPCPSGI